MFSNATDHSYSTYSSGAAPRVFLLEWRSQSLLIKRCWEGVHLSVCGEGWVVGIYVRYRLIALNYASDSYSYLTSGRQR